MTPHEEPWMIIIHSLQNLSLGMSKHMPKVLHNLSKLLGLEEKSSLQEGSSFRPSFLWKDFEELCDVW